MPIYEYECQACSCRFEVRQSFGDDSEAICPRCKGKARRTFSPVPVIFKGSGFYSTDHRKGKAEPTAKDMDKAAEVDKLAKSLEDKGDTASEAKPKAG
ncbi:MAG: FmdB family zinc ribbon protein [Chloroflexota bacterium]